MSKFDKPSKPAKLSKPASKSSAQLPAKESQKLEVVRIISPTSAPAPLVGVETSVEAPAETPPPELALQPEIPPPSESPEIPVDRSQPIPTPTELMQYRAIGVVQGRYIATDEQFSKGQLLASDGTAIDAVLLGKIISIVKKRLDISKDYLWVVYPRTRGKEGELHVQIAGVWAPEEMGKTDLSSDPGVDDGYFSIRGEVTQQSIEENCIIVKVRRTDPKKELEKSRVKFKLRLTGILPGNPVGYFWEINAQRRGNSLSMIDAKSIALIPTKSFRPRKPQKPSFKPKQKRAGDPATSKPTPRPRPAFSSGDRPEAPQRPIIKRPKPLEN